MWSEIKRRHTTLFLVSLLVYSLAQLDLALFGYAIPSIREEFGLTLQQIMLVVSSAFLIASVLIVWLGLLTDHFGRRTMFQLSFLTSSVLVAAHSLAPNPIVLAILRGSSIATGGMTYPISAALIAEEFPARFRGLFTGFLQSGYAIGWFIASLFAAHFLSEYGWRSLFLVSLLSIPVVFLIRKFIHEPVRFESIKKASKPRVRDLFREPYRRLVITLFCAQFLFVWAYAGSVFLFPSFMREARGLDISNTSLLIGMGNAISVFGYFLAAWVGEFVTTRRNTVIIWILLGALFFQCLIWIPANYYLSIALYGSMGFFFYGAAAVKLAFVAELIPTHLRATGIVVCGSLPLTLGSASGPMAVAAVVDALGWNLAFSVVVGVPLVLSGLLYFLIKPIKSGLEIEEIQVILQSRTI
jgi:MFS family permease